MRIGLMWADFSKDAFSVKVQRAVSYFEEKYRFRPNAIVVHPNTAITEFSGIAIRQSRSILPNHFWVGLEE